MQAIEVKYLPATNTRGARIKANAAAGSVTVDWPCELSGEEAHKVAALALCNKFGWPVNIIGGQLANGDYVFCFAV